MGISDCRSNLLPGRMGSRYWYLVRVVVKMSKVIYSSSALEKEMGFRKAQDFLQAQADSGLKRGSRVVRVFEGEGKRRKLKTVIIGSQARTGAI